jgi:hypothetical protein
VAAAAGIWFSLRPNNGSADDLAPGVIGVLHLMVGPHKKMR